MDFLPLITIPTIYFAVAFLKPRIRATWNICAICAAVLLTWLSLFALRAADFQISALPIGILMGMSAAGLMYKMEDLFAARRLKHFWLTRLILILGGFYGTLFLLTDRIGFFTITAIAMLIGIVIIAFLAQGTTHHDAVRDAERHGRRRSLLKKLDNCC